MFEVQLNICSRCKKQTTFSGQNNVVRIRVNGFANNGTIKHIKYDVQCLSGRVLDLISRGRWLKLHQRHCCNLEQSTLYSA